MLHDIREVDPNFYPDRFKLPYFLRPQQFYNIIDNLKSIGADILALDEPLIISENNIRNSKFVLTFDDGLKDHLTVARYLFKKRIKGVFFVPSGPVLDNTIIDSHKIQFIIAAANPEKIAETICLKYEQFFNAPRSDLKNFFISKWKNNIWSKEMVFITRILREFNDSKWKRFLLSDLFEIYVSNDEKSFSKEFYLDLNGVKEIISLGHIVGGHGHFSHDLRYEDFETIEDEIQNMDSFLNSIKVDKKYLAYANGGYNDKVLYELNKYSFDCAFTTGHRKIELTDDKMLLPRIDATKTNLIMKSLRLNILIKDLYNDID